LPTPTSHPAKTRKVFAFFYQNARRPIERRPKTVGRSGTKTFTVPIRQKIALESKTSVCLGFKGPIGLKTNIPYKWKFTSGNIHAQNGIMHGGG